MACGRRVSEKKLRLGKGWNEWERVARMAELEEFGGVG